MNQLSESKHENLCMLLDLGLIRMHREQIRLCGILEANYESVLNVMGACCHQEEIAEGIGAPDWMVSLALLWL